MFLPHANQRSLALLLSMGSNLYRVIERGFCSRLSSAGNAAKNTMLFESRRTLKPKEENIPPEIYPIVTRATKVRQVFSITIQIILGPNRRRKFWAVFPSIGLMRIAESLGADEIDYLTCRKRYLLVLTEPEPQQETLNITP